MKRTVFHSFLTEDAFLRKLSYLYGKDAIDHHLRRLDKALSEFARRFPENDEDLIVVSTPGRTEISGNHTDHNAGLVMAASINLDMVGVAAKNHQNVIRVASGHYPVIQVDLARLAPIQEEHHTSHGLVRGMAARMRQLGYQIGGFDCRLVSDIRQGSGVSSSAAFEVEIGSILNHLYNGGSIDPVTIAKIAQYAENHFFGKPSGLMDQVACAVGGLLLIDFEHLDRPNVVRITPPGEPEKKNDATPPDDPPAAFDFEPYGEALFLVETGTSHAKLTEEYAAVEREMKDVARALGKPVLRQCTREQFFSALPHLRRTLNDRALLRAYHYFNENERVLAQAAALKDGDIRRFNALVRESGRSSFMYCQNIYPNQMWQEQPLSLAFMAAEALLKDQGAWRLQGGGFGGMLQAFVPFDMADEFRKKMRAWFGAVAVRRVKVRPVGTARIK